MPNTYSIVQYIWALADPNMQSASVGSLAPRPATVRTSHLWYSSPSAATLGMWQVGFLLGPLRLKGDAARVVDDACAGEVKNRPNRTLGCRARHVRAWVDCHEGVAVTDAVWAKLG